MPVTITQNGDGTYTVRTPNAIHSTHTTLEKAERQARLLNALEHNPDLKPRKR